MMFLYFIFVSLIINVNGVVEVINETESYVLYNLTFKNGSVWKVVVPFSAEVVLPPNSYYIGGENVSYLYSRGDNIVVVLNDSGYVLYEIYYKKDEGNFALYFLFLLVFLLFLFYFFLKHYFGKFKDVKVEEKKVVEESSKSGFEVLENNKEGLEENRLYSLLSDKESKVLKVIEKYPGISFKDLHNIVGFPKSTLSVVLKSLVAKGLVDEKKKGISKAYYRKY